MSHSQTLGVGDALGTGDSYLTLNVLPPDLAAVAFDRLREQVKWDVMHHRGGEVPRLVAVEGLVSTDGSYPIYRHPADESPILHPFSPTVEAIRQHVQGVLQHPVNHVLIQFYRTGTDYISEHSDKTIDVVRGSNIVNVSLGAQRVMTLRLKRERAQSAETEDLDPGQPPTPRTTQRIPLPHNSMFVMGPETNAKWLHGIKQDNRFITYKSEAETFQLGERISLTFRHIGTFLNGDQTRIWGQGATSKTADTAQPVLHGAKESENLVIAFGAENHQIDFDWDKHYGMGFDVVNFKTKDDEEQML
ncbi:DNA oxidative demethylase ALKBH2 [Favolaschia claudopus]|uniref:DNA oxidative demethylase ALKBH2 n=1 Tax=Favolaschia claudopus TaxID=2862362 RepID=A0AAW0AR47_9AGAR